MAAKIASHGSKLVRLRELRTVHAYVEDAQEAASLHAGPANVVVMGELFDFDDRSISSISSRSVVADVWHAQFLERVWRNCSVFVAVWTHELQRRRRYTYVRLALVDACVRRCTCFRRGTVA